MLSADTFRLRQEADRGTGRDQLGEVPLRIGRDEHDLRQGRAARAGQAPRDVEAALVAEVDVHERHVRVELARQLNRLRARRRHADDGDALALQERPRRGEVSGVVVDYQ